MTEQPDRTPPDAVPAGEAAEAEWWQAEGMPWKHKPERADILCLSAISVAAIYGLVMLPLRPVIDSNYPLAQIAEAFAHQVSAQHFGKICLRW